MRATLAATGGQLVSERVSAVLASHIGATAAKQVLAEASLRDAVSGRPPADTLVELPQPACVLSRAEAATLLDPDGCTGAAGPGLTVS
ncbi:adenylosuccinate lyase [Streptomyces phaeochromogenes]|uniref:hypothetical protein n=1 Tax=Streptomyces phaeochromogenes TaxID=1923 RepID=UPI0027945706|nr:hypothetical protein [Streptomyces phaeochromogenes]MDQ0955806.1 adenylosuccinate lyase [Streptomyces phaeochromogenes]